MKETRIVITGMGVVSPNGIGVEQFSSSLRDGISGIRFIKKMKELNYRSHIGGSIELSDSYLKKYIPKKQQNRISNVMTYGLLAALECFRDANLEAKKDNEAPFWDIGCILGACSNGIDLIINDVTPKLNSGKVKKIGVGVIEKTMTSGVSSVISGTLGLGNKTSTNSSACSTGAEAVLDSFYHIKSGRAKAMLCGGTEGSVPYVWSGFDVMRILSSKHNDNPEKASRPFSKSSNTFVPGSGAGVLLLESLTSAKERGAKIYAEILGGHSNCGGGRLGGTMTASNPEGIKRCIKEALKNSSINPSDIDYINGHFTGTKGDEDEFKNWINSLMLTPLNFPYINSTKSLIGHTLSAAGAIETIATVIQLKENFIHAANNSDDLYDSLSPYRDKVPLAKVKTPLNIAVKSSFGFGDVNTVLVFKKI